MLKSLFLKLQRFIKDIRYKKEYRNIIKCPYWHKLSEGGGGVGLFDYCIHNRERNTCLCKSKIINNDVNNLDGGGGGSTAYNANFTFVDNVDNRTSISGGGGGTVTKSKLSNGEIMLVVG